MNKKKYCISLISFEGSSDIDISLTDKEYTLIKEIEVLSEENRTYRWMPILNISEKLPVIDKVLTNVKLEAEVTAWQLLGIHGNVSYRLARKNLHPKELKKILDKTEMPGIGMATKLAVKNFTESDYEKFDKEVEKLMNEESWTWKLSRWRFGSGSDCSCGEYICKKEKLIKKHVD